MPSNKVIINGSEKYEVPDSFMPPLEAYLKMVQEKCTPRDNCGFDRSELQRIRVRAFSLVDAMPKTAPKDDIRRRALVALGDLVDVIDAMKAREEGQTGTNVYEAPDGSISGAV